MQNDGPPRTALLILTALACLAVLVPRLLSFLSAGPAFSLTRDDVSGAVERAKDLDGTIDMTNVHRDGMEREAERSFKVFKERRMKDVDEFRARVRYDGEKVTVAPLPQKAEAGPDVGGLAPDERVYVFVSSSVPRATLRTYADALHRLRDPKVMMVLRGCVGGCTHIMPTVTFIREVLAPSKEEHYLAEVIIDPLLYRFYRIRSVPAIVYARNVSPDLPEGSEGNSDNMRTTPTARALLGDVSLDHALETINRDAGSQGLARLIAQLRRKDGM